MESTWSGASVEYEPELIPGVQEAFEDFHRQQYQRLSETDRTAADQLLQRTYYQEPEAARRLDPARVEQMESTWSGASAEYEPELIPGVQEAFEDFHRQQYQNLSETNRIEEFEDNTSSASPHSPHASSHTSPT